MSKNFDPHEAIAEALAEFSATSGNQRNDALNTVVFKIACNLIRERGDDHLTEVRQCFGRAARELGLDENEIRATLNSAISAAQKKTVQRPRRARSSSRGNSEAAPAGPSKRTPASNAAQHDDNNRVRAIVIWKEALPITGTIAEEYLLKRLSLKQLPNQALGLRFAAAVPMPGRERYSALIAAVTVPTTGEFRAIQRTALSFDGSGKANAKQARASLGGTASGAVVLGDLHVTDGELIEGEGIETVLSVCVALDLSGIATLSSAALGKASLPDERAIVLLVDRDAEAKAVAAAHRRQKEGRVVRLARLPTTFAPENTEADFNDLLLAEGIDAVRAAVCSAVPHVAVEAPSPVACVGQLPAGFRYGADGWIEGCEAFADATANQWHRVCSPLRFVALSKTKDGNYSIAAEIFLDGLWQGCSIPREMVVVRATKARALLAQRGVHFAEGPKLQKLIVRLLNDTDHLPTQTEVHRIGWHNDAFVLPDKVYGERLGQLNWTADSFAEHGFAQHSTLACWQTEIAARAVGNSRLIFGLSAALLGPLLRWFPSDTAGFHLAGRTSTGKTTWLRLAASVWGCGSTDGFLRTWNSSARGLELLAKDHHDTLLCFDELGTADAPDFVDAIYNLSSGRTRRRHSMNGQSIRSETWRLNLLSTGEVTVRDKILEGPRQLRGGQLIRIVDLSADAGRGLGVFEQLHGMADAHAFARSMTEASMKHFGHAGPAWVDLVVKNREVISCRAAEIMRAFEGAHTQYTDSPEVRRVLDRFALVAAAGALATEYAILPWPADAAVEATSMLFRAWSATATNAEAKGETRDALMLVHVQRVISQAEAEGRFIELNCSDELGLPNFGWRLAHANSDGWFVLSASFVQHVCFPHAPLDIIRCLKAIGALVHDQNDNQSRRRIGGQQRRGYFVSRRLFAWTPPGTMDQDTLKP